VKTVESMGIKKCIKKTGASYIGDNNDLVFVKIHIQECLIKGMGNPFMGATRTKDRRPVDIQ
jgi:hypothetical protein